MAIGKDLGIDYSLELLLDRRVDGIDLDKIKSNPFMTDGTDGLGPVKDLLVCLEAKESCDDDCEKCSVADAASIMAITHGLSVDVVFGMLRERREKDRQSEKGSNA